eukprot:SAG31_NODE_31132_length_371_cov_8.014706_1_plen_41_part_00
MGIFFCMGIWDGQDTAGERMGNSTGNSTELHLRMGRSKAF